MEKRMATLQAKLKLLMGLLRGNRAYTPPFFVDLDLTNYCNFKCLDCPYHSPALMDSSQKPEAMNFDLIRRLAEELNPHETPSIILQGAGEPLLYPQILEAVALFKQKGFLVTLLTSSHFADLIHGSINLHSTQLRCILCWSRLPMCDKANCQYTGAGRCRSNPSKEQMIGWGA
jgi:hypothetical protein